MAKENQPNLAKQENLSGFTLIEVTMAIVIMASALTILVGMQSSLVEQTIRGRNQQQAMLLARRILAGFEVVDPDMNEGTSEMSAAEALELSEVADERDPQDYAGYENFRVLIQFNYWGIPKIDPQAMQRILVRVMWGPLPGDSLVVSYFIASEPA